MGKLDEATIYLSGSMEYASDHGVAWRRKFRRRILQEKLNVYCIDPTDKPGPDRMKIGENKEFQENLQRNGKFKELRDYVTEYRHYDLRFVDISDVLIVAIDPTIPQWGTADETYLSERQNKPRYAICEGGLYKFPRWLLPVFELDDVFENVEEVIQRLCAIDRGDHPMDERWVLVRKYLRLRRQTEHSLQ